MPEPNLELLMQMVQKVLDGQRDIREDVREIKTRLGRLHVFLAEQSTRLDRFGDRMERVERRLEIVET